MNACDAMMSFLTPTTIAFLPSKYVHNLFKSYVNKKSIIPTTYDLYKRRINKKTRLPTLTFARNDHVGKAYARNNQAKSRGHRKNIIQTILAGQSDHQSYLSMTDALNLFKDAQSNKFAYPFTSSMQDTQSEDLPKTSFVYKLSPPSVFQEVSNKYSSLKYGGKVATLSKTQY